MKFSDALRLTFNPLLLRFRLGEGGIALFNIAHAWFATHNIIITLATAALSFLILCALYGFNDYIDRERDAQNPKKYQPFVSLVNQYPKNFLLLNLLLCAVLATTVFFIFGNAQALYLVILFIINALYSMHIKSLPFADIIIVALWGAAITLCVPQINFQLSIFAGIMTGIAHIYQMLSDKETDQLTSVSTAIVRYPRTAFVQIFLLCSLLAAGLFYWHEETWLIISAALPLAFYFLVKKNETAWLLSRVYFAGVWLILLHQTYGSI